MMKIIDNQIGLEDIDSEYAAEKIVELLNGDVI